MHRHLVVLLTGFLLLPVRAATLTWDADTTTPGAQDGSGLWSATASNWWDTVSLANVVWTDSLAMAVIGSLGTADMITNVGVTTAGITFDPVAAGNYTVTGGVITLAGAPSITTHADATIASLLGGPGFVKDGPGTLTLNPIGANTYVGTIVVSNGALAVAGTSGDGTIRGDVTVGAGAVLQFDTANRVVNSAVLTMQTGGTLRVHQNETIAFITGNGLVTNTTGTNRILTLNGSGVGTSATFDGTLGGPVALTANGPAGGGGTQVLSGPNTHTGQTIVNNLNLRVLHAEALGATNGNTDIQGQETSFASLELANGITLVEPINLRMRKDESGSFAAFAPHIRNIEGTNTLAGPLNLDSGGTFWTLQSDTGRLVIAVTLQSAVTSVRTLRLGGGADVEAGGAIQNGNASSVNVLKFGTGVLVYGRTNTYSGTTTVEAGTLSLGSSGGIANAAEILVQTGAWFDVAGVAPFLLAAGQTLAGGGTVTGNVAGVAGSRVNPGTALAAGTLTLANDLSLAGLGARFELTTSTIAGAGVNDLLEVAGDVDAGGSTVTVSPRSLLTTNSPYVLINYGGNLLNAFAGVDVTNARYSGTLDTTSSPGQVLATFSGGEISNLVWSGGSADWDAGISLNWNADSTTFLTPDRVRFDDTAPSNQQVNLVGALIPLEVVVDSTSNYTFGGSGRISGSTGLRKAGAGLLIVSNANEFTGDLLIEGGTLGLGHLTAWGSPSGLVVVTNGATLDLRGHGLNGQAKEIRISGSGVDGLGAIVNSGAHQQNALRRLALDGDATIGNAIRWDVRSPGYGDPVDLNGFTLTKVGAATNGFVQVTMTNAGSVVIAQGCLAFSRAAVDGPGDVRLLPGTTLLLENYSTNRFEKAILSSGGTIRVTGNALAIGQPLTLESATTVDVATVVFTMTNVVSGTTSGETFAKAGSGSLVLSAANTYTGSTTLRAGSLVLSGGDNRLPAGTTVNLLGSSSFVIASNAQTIAALTVPANSTVSNSLTGGGSLTINGSADLQLGPGGTLLTASQHIITDLSGLEHFTYAATARIFRAGLKFGTTNTASQGNVCTVTLAASNLIHAATLAVGDQSSSSDGGTSVLHLGQKNTLRVNLLNLGFSGRSDATLDFAAALTGASVTVRGPDGVSPLPLWRMGRVGQFAGAGQTVFSSIANFTQGHLDAAVTSLFIAEADTQGATSRAGTQNASFSMGAGTFVASTVTVGRIAGGGTLGAAYTARGTFTVAHASATVEVDTIQFAENTITASGGFTRTVTGTLNLNDGTLRARVLQLGLQTGSATAAASFAWTAGTLENKPGTDLTIDRVPVTLLAEAPVFRASGTNTIAVTALTPLSGTGGFTKDGSGTLWLAGSIGHLGSTTVSGGTLRVDGLFTDSSATTVKNGGQLSGTGIVAVLTIESGGILSPGASIGTLTATGGVTLQTGAFTVMEVDRTAPTSDVLVAASVTYGGTLVISNTAVPLQAGDSFKLFDATSYAGSFAAIDPPTPGMDLQWDTANLASNGTLAVRASSTLPTTNAPITASLRAGTNWLVTLSTESNVNYVLQANTNLLDGAGWQSLGTNLGTGSTITNAIPLDPSRRRDFIRFVTP